jgi:DNA-binding NarL/FixJ family response regulator
LSQEAANNALWALIPDLFLRVRIEALARAAGATLRAFPTPAALLAALAEDSPGPRAILVDLHARDDAAFTLLAALAGRPDGAPTLGFHSHVDIATRERALAAGCTRVVPRSALMNRFTELVAEVSARG